MKLWKDITCCEECPLNLRYCPPSMGSMPGKDVGRPCDGVDPNADAEHMVMALRNFSRNNPG